ncbi:hypothetical protein HK097_006766, partial [Rhizophlyctis rosea]
MSTKWPSSLTEAVKKYATYKPTSISLRQFVDFGHSPSTRTILRGSQFVRSELPIRLAHRVVELESLPYKLSEMPSIVRVKDWYTESFKELTEFPTPEAFGLPKAVLGGVESGSKVRYFEPSATPDSPLPDEVIAYNEKFVACLDKIKKRHDPTTTTIAQGVLELKDHSRRINAPYFPSTPLHKNIPQNTNGTIPFLLPTDIQSFLDRFYMSRIGIRMLIGQQIALHRSSVKPSSAPLDHVGIICTKTNLLDVAQDAVSNAREVCQNHYGLFGSPEITFAGKTDVQFMYVPSHLHHMLFELLKNSLRAVVERYGVESDEWPEIKVVVAEGREDITIKISDEGGGIPRSGMPLIWTY